MNASESIKAIAPALIKAQAKIKGAVKDATNPHFRSKYADLSSVVEAVKGPLLEQGITFLQGVQDAENGVAVETMLLHSSGEWLASTLRIPAAKQDAQGYGSAITYGRRYGLQSMCGVPAEDDDGNAATATAPKITPTAGAWEAMSPDMQAQLQVIADCVRAEMARTDATQAYKLLQDESEHAGLGTDEKAALWTRFDSKERAAMTKAGQQLRKAA